MEKTGDEMKVSEKRGWRRRRRKTRGNRGVRGFRASPTDSSVSVLSAADTLFIWRTLLQVCVCVCVCVISACCPQLYKRKLPLLSPHTQQPDEDIALSLSQSVMTLLPRASVCSTPANRLAAFRQPGRCDNFPPARCSVANCVCLFVCDREERPTSNPLFTPREALDVRWAVCVCVCVCACVCVSI